MGVFEEFQANARLTGHLEEVPGLGPTGIENLKGKGLHTTYQLIGYFLKLNRDEVAFANFLKELGCTPQWVKRTAGAIKERVADRGFKCEIKLSDHVIKTASSRFDDSKKSSFLQKRLTNRLSDDFFGIKNESGFHRAGIMNTDQLIGQFLSIINDPNPSKNTAKCNEFYAKLNSLGASPGHKSVIIYQMQAKLAVGIDTYGDEALRLRHLLPALPEVPEGTVDEEDFDAGRTGASPATQGTRHRPASNVTAGKMRQPEFNDAPKPSKPSKPSPGRSPMVVAGGGLVGLVGLYYWPLRAMAIGLIVLFILNK